MSKWLKQRIIFQRIKIETAIIMILLLALYSTLPLTAFAGQTQKASEISPHANELRNQKVEEARALISSVAAQHKELSEAMPKVKLLASAADLMWDIDKEVGRDLFQQACAYIVDVDEKIDKALKREAVLDLTARLKRRDQKLFDWFTAKLEQQAKQNQETNAKPSNRDLSGASSVRGKVLLDLAHQKLEEGKFEEASALLAESFVDGVIDMHGFYLRVLATKDAQLAMTTFQKGLDRVRSLLTHEISDVLGMASFLFNMQGTSVGGRRVTYYAQPVVAKPPQQLVEDFLNFAQAVILENAALVQSDKLFVSADTSATRRPQIIYLAIEQLLPIFEAHLPEAVPHLRQEWARMLSDLQAQKIAPANAPDFASPTWQAKSESAGNDDLEKELESAKKALTEKQRDDLYYSATIHALWREALPLAQKAAREIADSTRATQAKSLVNVALLRQSWHSGDTTGFNQILEVIGEPYIKVQAILWLVEQFRNKDDKSRVIELLAYADSIAPKVSQQTQRSQAFLMLSKASLKTEPHLSFEALQAAIRALNAADSISLKDVRSSKGDSFGTARAVRFGAAGMIKEAQLQGMEFNLFSSLTDITAQTIYAAPSLVDGITKLEIKLYGKLAIAQGYLNEAKSQKKEPPK